MNIRIILSFIAFTFLFAAFGQNNAAIDSLENILKTAKADTAKVNYLNALNVGYRHIGFKTAIQYADSALELAQRLDYKKGIFKSHRKIVNIYAVMGHPPESLENYFAHLKIFEERGMKAGIASCYRNIGIVYGLMGNYPEALEYHLAALKISEEIGDKFGIADCYGNIGNVYEGLGNHQEALEYYLASLKSWEEVGDKWFISGTYNSIGMVYATIGNLSEALKYYLSSLKIWEKDGDKWFISDTFNSIGMIYATMGNPSEALEYYLSSLKRWEEAENPSIATAYNNIGLIYQNQGNYAEALKKYIAALKIFEKVGYKKGAASSYHYIGAIYQKQGNYHAAREYLYDGLALSKEIRNKSRIKDIYKALSILESTEGNFEQALQHHRMYTLYKDSLFNEESNNQIALLRIQYKTEKKDREIELLNKDKELQEQKLEKQTLIRNGMIAGVVFIVLLGLLLFRSFWLRKKLEKQKAIIQERNRISADLHDDIGSGLSRIMLLSELEKNEAKTTRTGKGVEKIAAISSELATNMDEIVWTLNSDNDYVENLAAYIRRYAVEYFENSPVRLTIKTPGKMDHIPISGERRRNIFYTVKEALNNIIKHAQATEAGLELKVKQNVLSVVIEDNGKGLPHGELNRFGNGINNMRNRMKSINGNLQIESHSGTRITLSVPV